LKDHMHFRCEFVHKNAD